MCLEDDRTCGQTRATNIKNGYVIDHMVSSDQLDPSLTVKSCKNLTLGMVWRAFVTWAPPRGATKIRAWTCGCVEMLRKNGPCACGHACNTH